MVTEIKDTPLILRVKEFIRTYKLFIVSAAFLPVVAISFYLTQFNQDIRQRASSSTETQYYVSQNGNDNNDGSQQNPFKTIQKCATIAPPNSICNVKAGIYRETVTPYYSGLSDQPITYRAVPGEKVTISGTDTISTSWTQDAGNVYKVNVSTDLGNGKNQIFIDGNMVNEARWPNTGTDLLNPTFANTEAASNTTPNNFKDNIASVRDDQLPQIPEGWTGAYFNGFGPYGWNSYTQRVESQTGPNMTLKMVTDHINNEQLPGVGDKYFIFGKKGALDSPGEWFLDQGSKVLYLWHPQSSNPSSSNIEQKTRTYGFNLSGKSNIHIEGIEFFATSIKTDSSSSNNILDRLKLNYLTHYQVVDTVWNTNDSGVLLYGNNNTIKNSEINYSAGNGIHVIGKGHVIHNNKVSNVNYVGSANAAIRTPSSAAIGRAEELTITNNTMHDAGKAIIEGEIQKSKIKNNDFYHAGRLTKDHGLIYISGNMEDTEIAYNKLHDNKAAQYGGGIYLEAWEENDNQNVLIHHNAIWNNWANIQVNRIAKNIKIYNNTLQKDTNSILSNSFNPALNRMENISIYNNYWDHGLQIYNSTWDGQDIQNNLSSQPSSFTSHGGNDYQLTGSANAVNAGRVIPGITDGFSGNAPDVGAYELGIPTWTAGYSPVSGPTPTPYQYSGTPYQGRVVNIPGTVKASDFDDGGEGVAYHDTETANAGIPYGGGNYRVPDTAVDLVSGWGGATSPIIVSQIIEGEYLRYTVNVTTTGIYTFNGRFLTPGDGSVFHVKVDGQDVTGPITYNNTGNVFATVTKNNVPLTQGRRIIELSFNKNGTQWGLGQMDTFSFSLTSSPTVTQEPTNTLSPTKTPTPTPTPTKTPTPTPTVQNGTVTVSIIPSNVYARIRIISSSTSKLVVESYNMINTRLPKGNYLVSFSSAGIYYRTPPAKSFVIYGGKITNIVGNYNTRSTTITY